MTLKSFGCSFVFGSDLADIPTNNSVFKFSQSTWPALLANRFDMQYQCHARPGSGNLQIAEQVLNQCCPDSTDFFVINWAYIDRFDYTNASTSSTWNTLRPGDTDTLTKTYYQKLHSEYRDKLSTLIYARTVIDTLKHNNIKFLMTYMDNLMFDQQWHVSPAVSVLQNYIKPYTTTFEGETFLNWSRAHGYPESSKCHPLEQAHQSAADYMINIFDKQKTNDPARLARV